MFSSDKMYSILLCTFRTSSGFWVLGLLVLGLLVLGLLVLGLLVLGLLVLGLHIRYVMPYFSFAVNVLRRVMLLRTRVEL